jgi:hypothetical protein
VIAGLSIPSWLLILAAVGAGLAIELFFLRAQRRRAPRDGEEAP